MPMVSSCPFLEDPQAFRPRNVATLRHRHQALTQTFETRRRPPTAKPVAPLPPLSHGNLGEQRGARRGPYRGHDVPLLQAGASRLQRRRGRHWGQCCTCVLSRAERHGMLGWEERLCCCGGQAGFWEAFAVSYVSPKRLGVSGYSCLASSYRFPEILCYLP